MTSNPYGSHRDYIEWVAADAEARRQKIEGILRSAFQPFIESRTVEIIVFADVSVEDLARAISDHPAILKPLLSICNIAGRALARDLKLRNVNTYKPRLDVTQAAAIAGYLKPFLPPYASLATLGEIDRLDFVDKEVRKMKGRWERKVLDALGQHSSVGFKKRKFKVEDEVFEIDAAAPASGPIEIAVDVKRIEARQDIHKRCDEIVNKAEKLRKAYPEAKFAAVIYYPFVDDHVNVQSRLRSENIDAVVFAAELEETIHNAAQSLLAQLGRKK